MSEKQMIHRLWLGPRQMPSEYAEYGAAWQKLNPEWEVKDWYEEDLNFKVRNQDVIKDLYKRDNGRLGLELYVQMADVLGYELVYNFGGVYINTDIEPVRPLTYMYDRFKLVRDPFAAYEDPHRIVNSMMGGVSRDPFWGYVIVKLNHRYWENPNEEMPLSTGPGLLTDCVHAWRHLGHPFRVIPQDTFNQVHWSQIAVGKNANGLWKDNPDVIGVHHWGHKMTGRSNYVETATDPLGQGVRNLG